MPVVILGAGLTGLCTALALGSGCRVFEKEDTPGGLCRSFRVDGFTFDVTGHLLHYRDPQVGAFLEEMLPGELARVERKAAIFSHGTYTPYPFQINSHGLPPRVVEECLAGFLEARKMEPADPAGSFQDWVLSSFGEGFARHFFVPYNEKLYRVKLSEMTADWVSWSIPRPGIREVVDGALGIRREGFGYNAWFLYPAGGGIERLIRAVSRRVKRVETSMKAVEVRTREKIVRFESGLEVPYEVLVSTMPLRELVEISDLDSNLKDAAAGLRYVSVLDINLGVEAPASRDFHWVYFPEEAYPFYRVGMASNFCRALAPEGSEALYVEISHRPGEAVVESEMVDAALDGLEKCGILGDTFRVRATHLFRIGYAYVLYDRHRRAVLDSILGHLESLDILSIGRFGAWEYATMERAILSGVETGRALKGRFFEGER